MAGGAFGKARQARKVAQPTAPAAVVPITSARSEQQLQFAQGRQQPNLTLQDLPEPVDVGERTGALDAAEQELLAVCERAVDEFETAAAVAAKALANVRDRRLYRQTHGTFEDYVWDRFNRERVWAYRQIDRYEVSRILLPGGNTLLPSKQARELAPTLREDGPEAMQRQYEETAATGTVTGDRLRETRQRLQLERLRPPGPPQPGEQVEIVDAELVDDPVSAQLQPLRDINVQLYGILQNLDQALDAARRAGPPGIGVLNSVQRQAQRIAHEASRR